MAAVFRKILADLLKRRLATVLVTLTILAASALLTLTVITLRNMDASFERSFEELRGVHLWLYFDRSLTSRLTIRHIESLPGVTASTGLQVSQTARVTLGSEKVTASLRLLPEQPAVNRLRITAGRDLTTQDELGVLVDKRLADKFHVRPGDILQVNTAWGDKPLTVIGLAFNPTWDIYRTSQPPYLYVNEATFDRYFPDDLAWDWSLGLRLQNPNDAKSFIALAESAARKNAITAHTDWRDVRDAFLFNTQLTSILLLAFGLFALGASALILTNSISGAILAQFRDIGLLKALGFTQADLLKVYLGQNLILGMFGALLGVIAASLLAPMPLYSLARALDAPPQPVIEPSVLAGVWLVVQVVILAATLFPALNGARANTIRAITTGSELPAASPSILVKLALWLRLPIPVVLGAKNAFARRGRALMTLTSLTLGVMSLVFSTVLNGVLDEYMRDPALIGVVYQAQVARDMRERDTVTDSTARRILAQAPGVTAALAHADVRAKTADDKEFNLHAEEGDLARFPYQIEAGRMIDPQATDEIIIGVGLQNWLDLKVGDQLSLTLNDEKRPTTWRVVGVYREPADNGQKAIISLHALHLIDRQAQPTSYLLRLAPGADVAALRAYLKREVKDDLALTLVNSELSSLVQFRVALLALSVVLSVIALFSVLNTAVLNMREQISEVGTYKALGMTPAQVVWVVLTSGAILGIFAGLIGTPLGIVTVKFTLSALGSSLGFGTFKLRLDAATLILPVLTAILVSVIGSAIPARWAARLRVVEILQYE